MLKELFEGHFYGTFPKVTGKTLNLTEYQRSGAFSLLDPKACRDCHFLCSDKAEQRKQLKVNSTATISVISLDEVFSYVSEDVGETCDFMLEGGNMIAVVEMTCSTTDYVTEKRQKSRRQLYNTVSLLMTSPVVRTHIEKQSNRMVIFSWKETFDCSKADDDAGRSMTGMTVMADEVYSPDNESKFDFGFLLKEIRYPHPLVM